MTLEKAVSPPVFTKNNIVPNLLSSERKVYLSIRSKGQVTTSYSQSEENSKLIHSRTLHKSPAVKLHRPLFPSPKCESQNSVYIRKHISSTPVLGFSHTGVISSPPPRAVVVVRTAHVNSPRCPYTCSRDQVREIPPPMPRSGAVKRSELKEPHSDANSRIVQPETSLSLTDLGSVKERKTRSADGRPTETTTTCSFFYFIRRKKKSSRSPSPDARDRKSNGQHNLTRWSISCSSAQSGRRSEHTPSPSHKERRPSGQSQASSRPPLTPISSNPSLSVTSPKVPLLDSPSSPVSKKRPQYTSRSRPKHRRDRRRQRTSKRASPAQPDDGLKLEDLPPHPSLFRKTIVKISSEPDTEYLIPSANSNRSYNSNGNSSNNKYTCSHSDTNSRSRKNSKAESSGNLSKADSSGKVSKAESSGKISKAESCGKISKAESSVNIKSLATSTGSVHKKELQKEDSTQNLKLKSPHSASKTDIEENSHYLTTSSSDVHSRKFRSHSLPSFRGDLFQSDADTKVISDAYDFEFNPTDMRGPLNLSFCGCGFLGMYHLGVISCLTLRGPSFVGRLEKIAGASAGALMAAVLVTAQDKIEEAAEHMHNLAKEIRKKPLGALTPGYSFTRSLRYMVEDILPEDAHETARGKLFVSLTNASTKENELMSDFQSRDELIDALVASCYIPVYAGIKLPMLRGQKYIDGGLSDNLPKFETGRTIRVSPFDGKSDIGPKHGHEIEKKAHFISVHNQDVQVNMNNIKKGVHAFFPPKRQMLQEYFEKGRQDASRFLIREGLYEITHPPQTKAVLYESSV